MKYAALILAFILLTISCKKDPQVTTSKKNQLVTNSTSYMPLTVGNYWVYQEYNVDTNGIATPINRIDSLYAQKDTLIGNQTYYYINVHYSIPNTGSYVSTVPIAELWVTDSAGYIVSYGIAGTYKQHGLLCDPVHFSDTVLIGTGASGKYYVTPLAFTNDTVPAGIFNGVNMNATCNCLLPPLYANYPAFYTKYAPGVGICKYKASYHAYPKSGAEWRLIRFHI